MADTLLLMIFPWASKWGNNLLQKQNVSERNQKHFLCLGNKFCVRNKCQLHAQANRETFVAATMCRSATLRAVLQYTICTSCLEPKLKYVR